MKNTPAKPGPALLAYIVLACAAGSILILLLPADSLSVGLVYQGF